MPMRLSRTTTRTSPEGDISPLVKYQKRECSFFGVPIKVCSISHSLVLSTPIPLSLPLCFFLAPSSCINLSVLHLSSTLHRCNATTLFNRESSLLGRNEQKVSLRGPVRIQNESLRLMVTFISYTPEPLHSRQPSACKFPYGCKRNLGVGSDLLKAVPFPTRDVARIVVAPTQMMEGHRSVSAGWAETKAKGRDSRERERERTYGSAMAPLRSKIHVAG